VDPVPDPLLLTKSGNAGNRTRNLWICSQELRPLDHRGGQINDYKSCNNLHIKTKLPWVDRYLGRCGDNWATEDIDIGFAPAYSCIFYELMYPIR
jgi:hypothetical protein